jgi:hypothetical protein
MNINKIINYRIPLLTEELSPPTFELFEVLVLAMAGAFLNSVKCCLAAWLRLIVLESKGKSSTTLNLGCKYSSADFGSTGLSD